MSRGKDLIKNTGILMIAKISTQIVSFLLLPLYTSLLSTEQYGRIDIYTSLSMIILPFLTLQIEMALFRFFIISANDNDRKEIVSTSYIIVFIASIAATCIYIIYCICYDISNNILLYFFYFSQLLSALSLQTCRAQGDNVGYGAATFIASSLSMMLNVLFIVVFHWKVEGILAASIIAQLLSVFFMLFRTKIFKYIDIACFNAKRSKELLAYSLPLVFNQIASWAINYSDRLIILVFWNEGVNGIYSVANKFSNIVNTFFGVYNVAWTENVVRSMSDEDGASYIFKVFNLTFAIYTILITGIINLLPFVFNVFVNAAFRDSFQHVPILLIAMLFSGMAANVGSIYIAYKRTKEVSITTMLAGICNVSVHMLLLKTCGLYAASISTLVSFVALFIYRIMFVRKYFKLKIEIKYSVIQIIILLFAWFAYAVRNPILEAIGLAANLLSTVGLFYINKDLIMSFLKGSRA